ncbi:hypothetical protein ACVWW1_000515 [Bradyrhizobium sp. JR3.5]
MASRDQSAGKVAVQCDRIGWRTQENPLDDEQEQAGAADRNRKIGDTD